MAVRIELFTVDGTIDFEVVEDAALDAAVAAFESDGAPDPAGAVRCVGWLSASDADEPRLTGWCDAVDECLGIGLLHQGLGEDRGLDATDVPAADDEPEASWAATVRAALQAAAGGRIAWRTNFDDVTATTPDDDYPTASHRADTDG